MATADNIIRIYPTFDKAGYACYQLTSLPADSPLVQQCIVYPERIIPVVFVPGVMGSNLKNDNKKKPYSVWNLDSKLALSMQWAGSSVRKRKRLLNPNKTQVDDSGKVDEKDEPCFMQNRRERGWGSVAYLSYGEFLGWLQDALHDFEQYPAGERHQQVEAALALESGDITLDKADADRSYKYLYPVFAVGYNWLESNVASATQLGKKIDQILAFYQNRGRQCEQVILVTHSMGGLVARHYTEHLGGASKVLGVVHGVMPARGAAATYRRMKAGTEYAAGSAKGMFTSHLLGGNGEAMTAVLAQAPGPLQLLPGKAYGSGWLKIRDEGNEYHYPKDDPYQDIYLQRDAWWGLCEAQFINPGGSLTRAEQHQDWDAFSQMIKDDVEPFIEKLSGKYHTHTYAFYSADKALLSFGDVCWGSNTPAIEGAINRGRPRDATMARALDNTQRRGSRNVATPLGGEGWAQGIYQTYRLLPPQDAGDGTVPVRSGRIEPRHLQALMQVATEHEAAYRHPQVRQFTLCAVMKMTRQYHTSRRSAP